MSDLLRPPRMPAVTAPTPRLRQAAVVSVQAGPPQSVTMHLAGDTTTDIVGVRHLDSYAPVAGDSVWVLQNDSDYLIVGRLSIGGTALSSGGRVATTEATTDSSTFTTTEVVIDSVTAALVINRVYRVRWVMLFTTATGSSNVLAKIRQDSLTGTQAQQGMVQMPLLNRPIGITLEHEFTAASTASKTFVGTAIRDSGTGTLTAMGATTHPRYLYVDYIRG